MVTKDPIYRRRNTSRYQAVRRQAERLEAQQLECRTFGHAWGQHESKHIDTNTRLITSTCARCEAEDRRKFSARGAVLSRSIAYPEGYLFEGTGMLEGADRNIVREVFIELFT